MGHYTNLTNGRYIMTEANALRHFIRLANHALLVNDINLMHSVYNEATYHINVDKCYKCSHDDFGYCYFRGSNSIPAEEHFKICFENWVKAMKHELNVLLKKKGKVKGL